jgi:hypothetical protein
LTGWLRQRLAEPPLRIVQEQTLLSRPAIPVVGMAAALACAPGSYASLFQAAQSSITQLGWDRPEDAARLVDLLSDLRPARLKGEHDEQGAIPPTRAEGPCRRANLGPTGPA